RGGTSASASAEVESSTRGSSGQPGSRTAREPAATIACSKSIALSPCAAARLPRPAGQRDGTRARRDDRMLEVDRPVALRRRDAHLLRAGEGAGARHELDAARLRELRESTRELPDDAVLVCAELREVELRRAELDAGVGEPARRGEHLRDVQQRLGRAADDVQADAAERGMALD